MATDEKLFLDSGAFSLFFQDVKKHGGGMEFYESDEFWQYVDDYAEFVHEFRDVITYYANVDVIGDPQGSYDVLKYLEDEHGLDPVPVVHFGNSVKWVSRYIDEGYDFIALGGFVGKPQEDILNWCHKAFRVICDDKGMPRVKTHGFAMTSFKSMTKFPWFSVDSASWVKMGGFGVILIPKRGSDGEFIAAPPANATEHDFKIMKPFTVTVSNKNGSAMKKELPTFGDVTKPGSGLHFDHMRKAEQKHVVNWLESVGLQMEGPDGVRESRHARMSANLFYFEKMTEQLPDYPWAYKRVLKNTDAKPFFQLNEL